MKASLDAINFRDSIVPIGKLWNPSSTVIALGYGIKNTASRLLTGGAYNYIRFEESRYESNPHNGANTSTTVINDNSTLANRADRTYVSRIVTKDAG